MQEKETSMPQLANLVLTDRAATPVNHTFTPLDIQGGIGVVVESSGVPIGDRRCSITLSKTKTQSPRYKPSLKFVLPVVQDATVNGVTKPTVVRTSYVDITFNFPSDSSPQERKDAVAFAQSALDANKWTNDVLVNLQGVY